MSKTNDFYVYVHRRKTDGEIFYIGKGRNRRAWTTSKRSDAWNNVVRDHGFIWDIVASNLREETALELEIWMIAQYGRDNLVNLSAGGFGLANPAPSIREKMRISARGRPGYWKGKKRYPETIEKMSRGISGPNHPRWGLKGPDNPLYGRKHSEEHKRKIGDSLRGRKITPEARKNLKAAKAGDGHHMFDCAIYEFEHSDGRKFSGTQFSFRNEFGFSQSQTCCLVRGKRKSPLDGWIYLNQRPKAEYAYLKKSGDDKELP